MKSDFRNLDVWKKGKEIRIFIFNLVKKFPDEEKYRLVDQMIRASRSVTANIAEGYGRYNYQDNIRFCRQSRGSIFELLDHIEVALECVYINNEEYLKLQANIEEILAILNGYVKYLKEKKTT
ncbi:MAG: four helix bundle protein [Nitrospinae bacterium]|nr:four helix bundle protein [Nitrospinota bacterium]MBI3815633.1 four helix bundle protein [Nitrospinota bacterium]